MHGFILCDKKLNTKSLNIAEWTKKILFEDFQVLYNPLPKFEDDHIFSESDKYIILLDGVIFNKSELMINFQEHNWKECFTKLYELSKVPDCLRGSFRGLIYEKAARKITVFTNHTGEKTVYYTNSKELGFCVSSHINIIKNLLCSNGKEGFRPNIQAHYELLLTGSVLHGNTPYKNIFRLTAGKILEYTNDTFNIKWYHKFKNTPEHEASLDECVEKANSLLRQAVNRIFKKSKEYGYRPECDLSGGLDSRFSTWVAHDLGYENILNICYCVNGNLDNKISKKIAKDIGNEYFFLPMDSSVLKDIDEKTLLGGGQVLYMLSTGALDAVKRINNKNIGIMCTGLMGEMQNAYWTEGSIHTKAKYITNRKSQFYQLKIPEDYSQEYDNYEQMNLYEYSYNLFLLSSLIRQEYAEVTSPFLDPDYMDFIFKIPLKMRKNYFFSENLMCKKYPLAAKYNWQGKRMPVEKHLNNKLYVPKLLDNARNFLILCINKSFRLCHINHQFYRKDDMNPIEKWYRNSKDIRQYLDDYFSEGIEYVTDESLKADLQNMYKNSPLATDKIQVINVVSVWKNYIA